MFMEIVDLNHVCNSKCFKLVILEPVDHTPDAESKKQSEWTFRHAGFRI